MAWTNYLPWNAISDFNDLVDEYLNYKIVKGQNPTTISHKFDYYGNRRKQGVEPAYKESGFQTKVVEPAVTAVNNWLAGSKMGQDIQKIINQVDDYISIEDSNDSDTTTFIPTSNSASGVADGTVEASSPFDSYLTYLNKLKEINEANNAFNVEQAQKQMDFQAKQNKIFMDFNALEAQKSRDWQTEMSNTAYQRQVADMQAAGLNPVLAASGGNGASIGSGTAASASGSSNGAKASADNLFGSAMLSMMNSAMNIAEKSATSAINASAVAMKQTQNESPLSFRQILKDTSSVVNLLRGVVGLFK